MNKTEEKALIKKLRRKCYFLWRAKVIKNAGGKCEYCSRTDRPNAHHIESYSLNRELRYDPRNGICLCSTCHKFGRFSAHKSFIFMYRMMIQKIDDLNYLNLVCQDKLNETVESLQEIIKKLQTPPPLLKRRE